jgi:signal transduction histidine kinase
MPQGGRLEVILEEERSGGDGALHAAGADRARESQAESRIGQPVPSTAVLRIADEGTGIPAEIREKIFDLYFTTKSGGSGIGLAMTYRILQLHYGSVEVESRQGRGTEFRLRIPLAATERGRRHLQPASVESEKGFVE